MCQHHRVLYPRTPISYVRLASKLFVPFSRHSYAVVGEVVEKSVLGLVPTPEVAFLVLVFHVRHNAYLNVMSNLNGKKRIPSLNGFAVTG